MTTAENKTIPVRIIINALVGKVWMFWKTPEHITAVLVCSIP
jgi:hypothetical protein